MTFLGKSIVCYDDIKVIADTSDVGLQYLSVPFRYQYFPSCASAEQRAIHVPNNLHLLHFCLTVMGSCINIQLGTEKILPTYLDNIAIRVLGECSIKRQRKKCKLQS